MPAIGLRCHELRIIDQQVTWRLIYRLEADAIVILEVFRKQSQQTPHAVIDACRKRIQSYEA